MKIESATSSETPVVAKTPTNSEVFGRERPSGILSGHLLSTHAHKDTITNDRICPVRPNGSDVVWLVCPGTMLPQKEECRSAEGAAGATWLTGDHGTCTNYLRDVSKRVESPTFVTAGSCRASNRVSQKPEDSKAPSA